MQDVKKGTFEDEATWMEIKRHYMGGLGDELDSSKSSDDEVGCKYCGVS